ncbi:MAG TPA: amidohydrolase, partial [Bacteroidia bacterium]|nr:amidohydrolase [Bacteroidia bacterium]
MTLKTNSFLHYFFFLIFICLIISCTGKRQADLIIFNAKVYTVDSAFSSAESFAVKDGKFIAVGNSEEIRKLYEAKEEIDAKGKFIYPGLIDSHCHFYPYGIGLQEADLVGTNSFDEVIQRLTEFSKNNKRSWIIGRGWDQNDWDVKEFPDKTTLDELFKDIPVLIYRVDGHAALANSAALKLANVTSSRKITGGVIGLKNKELTGILVDNAVDLVQDVIPAPSKKEISDALQQAQNNCFAVGLTTVDDAGLKKNIVNEIDSLQKTGMLKIRIYAMLTDNVENMDYYLKNGNYKTERLNVCSFKFYADGALGSRGACLLEPYADKNEQGFLLSNKEHYYNAAVRIAEKNFQMNTHCIGDSAVRFIQGLYASVLSKASTNTDRRWRIEHFQVTTPEDLVKLNELPKGNIIPSVQPTHATSDMYWAKDRLGAERIRYAYAYKDLLKACGMLALGTDFPVESINPFYTFYAAVARKDLKGFPQEGFQMENALSREETLKGMTIWGAYANFEDKEKGSIEPGKLADSIILNDDLMK